MNFLSLRKKSKASSVANRFNENGYTILELLVVLGIIALLAALVGPRILQYLSKAKTETAQIQIKNITTAMELYRLDVGEYPSQEAGLSALIKAPSAVNKWNGPYLNKASGITDPWGKTFQYRIPGKHGDFDLYSFGRDNTEGGEGENKDITNW